MLYVFTSVVTAFKEILKIFSSGLVKGTVVKLYLLSH